MKKVQREKKNNTKKNKTYNKKERKKETHHKCLLFFVFAKKMMMVFYGLKKIEKSTIRIIKNFKKRLLLFVVSFFGNFFIDGWHEE